MQLVIRRADTGAVIASSGEMSSPKDNDVLLQCMLSEARLTSMVRDYDVSVTRLFQTCEIARYSGGQRVAPDPGQLEAEAIRRECACTSERFCLACYQRACKEGR